MFRPLALAATFMLQLTAGTALQAPPTVEVRDPKADAFTTALGGDWKGTLEYRDYSNDKRVTLPTTLEARPAEDGRSATLKFRYDEGKGRFVESKDTVRIDPKKSTFAWESEGGKKSEYALAGLDAFAEKHEGELVLTGTGVENKVDVEVRQTITLKGDELTLLRETRKPGGSFAFRNTYKFRRVATERALSKRGPISSGG